MPRAFQCTACRREQPASNHRILCDHCGGPMDLAPGPDLHVDPSVTLGEGNTPVVRLQAIAHSLGLEYLCAKLEQQNPTGSFKDRGAALLVSALRDEGITRVAEDSSGNAGASIAAYCAHSGIEADIFAPALAPTSKLEQIAIYGAHVKKVQGTRQAVAQACQDFCRENDIVYASHNLSPYFIEGTRTFASEVMKQMDPPPHHILFPVGNGSLIIGTWKDYGEAPGPRLHAIQSRECPPIAAAFEGRDWSPPTVGIHTVAGGIAVDRPPRAHQVLAALTATGGRAMAVSEEEIVVWQQRLAREEGIFVEPTSAAALAGAAALVAQGHIAPSDRVLLALTGSGLKDRIPPAP